MSTLIQYSTHMLPHLSFEFKENDRIPQEKLTKLTVALIRRILAKQGDYSGERESTVLDGHASVGFLVSEFIDEISSRVWVETYI